MVEHSSKPATPLAYVVERLRASEVTLEPYPHYYIENVFPDGYYQTLLNYLPGSSVYQNLFEVSNLKLDNFRHRDQRDLNEGWTDTLPNELRTFWNDFSRWFLGSQLARTVLDSFAEALRPRIGEKQSWPDVSIEAQLIRHRAGKQHRRIVRELDADGPARQRITLRHEGRRARQSQDRQRS